MNSVSHPCSRWCIQHLILLLIKMVRDRLTNLGLIHNQVTAKGIDVQRNMSQYCKVCMFDLVSIVNNLHEKKSANKE